MENIPDTSAGGWKSFPSPPPAPSGPTEPVFTPTFMKALQMFTGAIPALDLEAKNSTLVDTVMRNKQFRESMFKLALLLCSSVAELVDKDRNPNLYGAMRFFRNIIALENVRREIEAKFIVHGGTNRDSWDGIVRQTEGTDGKVNIEYVPHDLDDVKTVLGPVGCHNIYPGLLHAMYEYGTDGKEFTCVSSRLQLGFFAWNVESLTARSIYMKGPTLQSTDDGPRGKTVVRTDSFKDWYWLQAFEVTPKTSKGTPAKDCPPFTIIFQLMRANLGTEGNNVPLSLFMQSYVVVKLPDDANVPGESYMENHRTFYISVTNALLKVLRYSKFDPRSTVISVNAYSGFKGNNFDATCFFSRNTKYSGENSVHILSDYDTIRDGIGRCIETHRSRGYAFVGCPGTGKTIMMNQLVNEFPDIPVVKFSMSGFEANLGGEKVTILEGLIDVLQSLHDAGMTTVFLCCDDMDSVDMSKKNSIVEKLILLMDGIHGAPFISGTVIFMATINDPSSMHSTIIKRGKRIDEVIEVQCPDAAAIRRLINHMKDKDDPTDYASREFSGAIRFMARNRLSLADLSNAMSNMQIYGKPGKNGKYTGKHLKEAVKRILVSRENASKQYNT